MKGTAIKKFPIFTLICLLMAAIFVALELIPAVSAWSTLTGGNKEQTKYITEFESVNPVEYYELENGGSYKDLDIPQKVRAVVELPQDIQLSTFKEEQAPEQQDELLPKYEYSHTVDKLMLEAEEDTSSADITSSAEETSSIEETASSLVEEETSSQSAETESFQADDTSSEESSMTTVTEEETQELLDESSKTSYNSAKVYSFVDSTGKTQYRVYGSIDGGEAQWYAVDKEGIMLGVVEELDANWDFSKLDSTVAGTYQVKVQLPENYVLNQGVEIAYMQIMVAQENSEQVSKEQVSTLASSSSFERLESVNGTWNSQTKSEDYRYIYSENEGSDVQLTASFSYDVSTKDTIQAYWDNRSNTPTTDDGMGVYLNWVMYGYNIMTGERSTWVIREENVTGGTDNVERIENINVDLTLGDDDSDGITSDGRGIAEITITIPSEVFTYADMNQQVFYLFAWNEETNAATEWKPVTDYKALRHTDDSGQQTPYTQILEPIFDSGSGFHNALTGNVEGMTNVGIVPNAYWYINVVPNKITQTDDSANDQEQSVILENGQATQTLTATFKYDNSIPWNVQNVGTTGSRYAIRIVIYKQSYGSTTWENVTPIHGDGTFGSWADNYEATITSYDEAEGTFTVTLTATNNELTASYENYGAKYKIVAYNYATYTGNMSGLLTDGNLNSSIGTTIPSNTTTVTFKPKAMESTDESGTATGTIEGVEFTAPKTVGEKTNITFSFQGDDASWLNGSSQSNTEMEQLFSTGGDNIIVSLWKRESDTGDFTFVDSFSEDSTLDAPTGDAADTDDYITSVTLGTDGKLSVEVQAGTNSNTNGTEYRVYAWYVTSNGDSTYDTSQIEDATIFGQADPTTISGIIPYATATVDMQNQAPDYYVTLPSDIILLDGDGNVKEAGTDTDLSSQYAGTQIQVSYNTTNIANIPADQIPELTVEVQDNVAMTSQNTSVTGTHTVGIYFTDGYKNVTDGTQQGYVTLGTLSTQQTVDGNSNQGLTGQTTPVGDTLQFYLNTLQGNNGEIYTAAITFWFDIISQTP